MPRPFFATASASVLLCLLLPLPLAAQPDVTTTASPYDDVVVTTGFRDRTLSETIGSTTVIDANVIEARGAEHIQTVLGTAANVTMTSGASRGRFVQIRGIGDLEQFVEPKHYPSIGVSVDGIDLGGLANAAMLFDIERVTVLRGPQGTRFGSSALAGQIDLRSIGPTAVFDAYVDVGVADYGTRMLGFAAGGPLADNLSGRIAVQQHRSDGYIENAYLGRDDTNGYDESTLRGKLRFTPTDALRLDLTAIRFESDNGYDAYSLDNARTTLSDQPGRDDLSLAALGLAASWQLATGGSIEASLSWLDSEITYGFDEDWTYVGICDGTLCDPVFDYFSNTDRYVRAREDVSLDLRWLGQSPTGVGVPRRYVLGIYAQDRQESLVRDYYGPFTSDYAADRAALYGQVEMDLSRRLMLTLGLRYERFDDDYGDSNAFTSASTDNLLSGEIALSYDATERSTVYALLARGNKPGGINTEASSVYPFVQPRFQDFLDSRLMIGREELTNVELGIKTVRLDGALAIRGALFQMIRDDAQLESWFWDPENFLWIGLLDNAEGDNIGAEIELDYAVTDRWQLSASLGWLDTEIDTLTTFDLDLDDFVDRSGVEQAKSPSWQAYLGSQWRLGRDWRVAVDIEARDSHRFGYYHDATIGRATLVNASVQRSLGATELTLWARNLADEDVAVHGLYFANDPRKGWINERYLQLGEPRLVGLSLRHSF